MACIEALLILNHAEYSPEDVVRLSGRGGTSGVGVNVYFEGGFSVDVGRERDNSLHGRSGDQKVFSPAKLLSRVEMPEWQLGVWIPTDASVLSAEQEEAFFLKNTPLSLESVKDVLYVVIEGVGGGVVDQSFEVFSRAIQKIQKLQWKSSEISLYGGSVRDRLDWISSKAITAGMSSLGPSIYLVSQNLDGVRELILNRYKDDEELFFKDFANAFSKLLALGCENKKAATGDNSVGGGIIATIKGLVGL
jgi:beta-ribofuranosylaminobenzene 5'-phosphate synthase